MAVQRRAQRAQLSLAAWHTPRPSMPTAVELMIRPSCASSRDSRLEASSSEQARSVPSHVYIDMDMDMYTTHDSITLLAVHEKSETHRRERAPAFGMRGSEH